METYVQKTNKMPDDIIKVVQQMKRPTLGFPPKPTKATCLDAKRGFRSGQIQNGQIHLEGRIQGNSTQERKVQGEQVQRVGSDL